MTFKLRPYQIECLDAIAEQLPDAGSGIVVAPTGSGKTEIISQLPRRLGLLQGMIERGRRMLVIAHRKELIDQAIRKISMRNPELRVEAEKAEQYASDAAHVVVASVQTLGQDMSERLARFDASRFDLVVIDECHHSIALTYKRILDYFAHVRRIGFTATPERTDGVGLKAVYKMVLWQRNFKQMMLPDPRDPESPYLSRVVAYKIRTNCSLAGVSTYKNADGEDEFAKAELAKAVNNAQRNQVVVDAYRRVADGKRAGVFCVDVAHTEAVTNQFRWNKIPAAMIVGTTPDEDRQKIYRDFHEGVVRVVVNCNVLTEGFDEPRMEAVLMARPTQSALLYAQQAGRSLRLCDICNRQGCEHKPYAIIVDLVDNTRLPIPTAATLVGLPPEWDFRGGDLVEAAQCADSARQVAGFEQRRAISEEIQRAHRELRYLGSYDDQIELRRISTLCWMVLYDKTHVLKVENRKDNKVSLRVKEDLLKAWHVVLEQNDSFLRIGVYQTRRDALVAADRHVLENYRWRYNMMLYNASWRKDPMSPGQAVLLRNFKVYRPGLTKGEAQQLIDCALETSASRRKVDPTRVKKRIQDGFKLKAKIIDLHPQPQQETLPF